MMSRVEHIGRATLYLGDCLEVMPSLGKVTHIICDPPYESRLHDAKAHLSNLRKDSGPELKEIDFSAIDAIRAPFVALAAAQCEGWFIAFCTVEGVAKWADEINPSPMKYKRACAWIKPDSTPQLNGQCPAQGFECFVAAWAGTGHSRWSAGGKRGVYTHCVNNPEREGTHPTEKPRRLMSAIISDFASRDNPELILDPFMGSGTTGVAAIMSAHNFIGIEKDERYFDVACRRIEQIQRQGDFFVDAAA